MQNNWYFIFYFITQSNSALLTTQKTKKVTGYRYLKGTTCTCTCSSSVPGIYKSNATLCQMQKLIINPQISRIIFKKIFLNRHHLVNGN